MTSVSGNISSYNQSNNNENESTTLSDNTNPVMTALYDFNREASPEISMNKNDILEVLDMSPALNGWAYAKLKKNGEKGYVPVSYIMPPDYRNHSKSKNMDDEKTNKFSKPNYLGRNFYNKNFQSNPVNFPDDPKVIICSFHRDYVPESKDLIAYFNEFGDLADDNIEVKSWSLRQIPVSIVKFTSANTTKQIINLGQKHAIPTEDGQSIHIRIFKNYEEFNKNINLYKQRTPNKFSNNTSSSNGSSSNHNHNHNHSHNRMRNSGFNQNT